MTRSIATCRGQRPFRPRSCENCRATADVLRPFVVPNQGTLWKCGRCGLYQRGCPVPSSHYRFQYHSPYWEAHSRKLRTATERIEHLAKMIRLPSPRLLDIGCSIGATVAAAEHRGWQGYGVDVSRDAVDVCLEQGLRCQCFDGFILPYPSEFFDVVTAWHVIEHVPSVRLALDEWFRVLRPDGLLAIETPAANCWKARILGPRYEKFWPAEHTYAFTRDTLRPFLWDAGFELVAAPWLVPPAGHDPASLAVNTVRRWQERMARWTGCSKSFCLFARRPASSAWDLPACRAA